MSRVTRMVAECSCVYIRTYRARSHLLYVVGAQEEHSHALLSHFCCERHSLETRPSDIFTTYSVYPVSQPTQLSYSVQQSRGQCSSCNMSVLHRYPLMCVSHDREWLQETSPRSKRESAAGWHVVEAFSIAHSLPKVMSRHSGD